MSKLTALLIIIIIILMLLLISALVGAVVPITFVNSWTRTVSDGGGLLPQATTISVATNNGDSIVIFMDGHDCDTAAGINYTISDNGNNFYTWVAQRMFGNCGIVDDQHHTWVALQGNATTVVTVTRTGGTANSHNAVAIIAQSYSGAFYLGNKATGVPNTAFPELVVSSTTNISWAVGFIHFYSNPVPFPPGGFNAGRFVTSVATGLTGLQNMGMDNNRTDNGTAGGGTNHVCIITEYCIFPNLGNAVSQYYIIFELIPQTNPTAITLSADNIQFDSARLNGNLSDLGVSTTVNIWFSWGDNITTLGNNTTPVIKSSPTLYSFTIGGLLGNHTYYFRFHAENSANTSQFSNGVTLTFVTSVNLTAIQFGNYGWVFGFIGALILGLWGAHWIKRKREEH